MLLASRPEREARPNAMTSPDHANAKPTDGETSPDLVPNRTGDTHDKRNDVMSDSCWLEFLLPEWAWLRAGLLRHAPEDVGIADS